MKAIFFDAGNTLIHAWPRLGEVYRGVCLRHGFDISVEAVEDTLRAVWSGTDPELGITAWQDLNTSDEHDARMWREIATLLRRKLGWPDVPFEPWFHDLWTAFGSAEAWRPFPDVEPVLSDLEARGVRLGVISNWDSRLVAILRDLGLARRMACVVVSAQVGVRKPDPGIFRHALEAAGVAARDAAHVGDVVRDDVEGARAAGLLGLLLDRAGAGPPRAAFPVLHSLAELPAALGFM